MNHLVKQLAASVAARHGLRSQDLLGDAHRANVVRARHELWSLVIDSWGLSYAEAERVLGRDRTAIATGVRQYRAWRDARDALRARSSDPSSARPPVPVERNPHLALFKTLPRPGDRDDLRKRRP
jgi:chromosomal replication initiation ATPase DnaA